MSRRAEGAREQVDRGPFSLAEWVSLGVGLLLVGGLVGAVLYLHVARGDAPAAFAVRPLVEETRADGGRFYLPLEVRNHGDRAAEQIRVRVDPGAAPVEVELDRLAGRSTVRSVVALADDPRARPLSAAVVSFVEP